MMREVSINWTCLQGSSVETYLVEGEDDVWHAGAARLAVWRAIAELQETNPRAVITNVKVRDCPSRVLR